MRSAAVRRPDAAAREQSFDEIFDREVDWVVRTLQRLGVRSADAEDVAQQVFVSVLAHLDENDPTRPLRPWLFAFALRAAANHRRLARHRREVPEGADDQALPAVAAPEADLERREERALLLAALGELDLDRRAVIVMHDLDDMSAPTIAEALGIPLNTVYSRIRLGRQDLAAAVRRPSRRSE